MARMKASMMDKMRLTAAKHKKHRTRRIRAFRTPIPRDADVSLVKSSDASAASAPQRILSDRDDAVPFDVEENEQDKLKRMNIKKALVSTHEWFQTFQKEIEEMRRDIQAMQIDPKLKA